MKKINFTEIFSAFFVIIFVVSFFVFSNEFLTGAKRGLDICGNVIIPSLFPFLIISSFVSKSNFAFFENKITAFISEKVFCLPPCTLSVIFMSLIGGFPVGIRMINELYDSGKVTRNTAERLSLFCVNAGPAFVINAVGVMMIKNKKAGVIIFISITLASLFIAFASRFFYKNEVEKSEKICAEKSFSEALVKSVSDSTNALISICSWIIIVSSFLPLIDKMNYDVASVFLKAISEVTTGAMIFAEKYPAYFLSGIIAFGGLCVHCQLLPNLNKMKIRLPVFFLGRILSAILSMFISKILFTLFPCEVQTFSTLTEVPSGGLSVSIPAVASLFFMCGLLILDLSLDRSKKIC